MKQDVIIRWLMESVDAEQLAQANENGTTISYFAGVAQRFPANDLQANNNARPRRNAPAPAVAEERDEQPAARRQPARQPAAAPAVDLNAQDENPAPARQPARRAVRQAQAGEDRIRVGQY